MNKKIYKLFILVASLQLLSVKAFAGDFSFGLTAQGQNFWVMIPQLPVNLINQALGGGAYGYTYDWVSVKDEQGKIKMDNGNYFGFKAKDLFNNFGYGVTFGYQPRFSPFGVFVNGGYKFRQFRMQPDRNVEEMYKYKLNSWFAGATLRFTILPNNYSGWSPIIEVGTNYNKVFSSKAPYGGSASQFGDGFSTRFGIGVRLFDDDFEGLSIALTYEMPHYDYFNRNFETLEGLKPYENIKSKNHSISLRMQIEF